MSRRSGRSSWSAIDRLDNLLDRVDELEEATTIGWATESRSCCLDEGRKIETTKVQRPATNWMTTKAGQWTGCRQSTRLSRLAKVEKNLVDSMRSCPVVSNLLLPLTRPCQALLLPRRTLEQSCEGGEWEVQDGEDEFVAVERSWVGVGQG